MEYRVLGEYSTRYPSPPNFPDKVTARIGRVCHVGSRGSTSSIPFPRFSELESKNSEKLRDIGKLSGLLVTRAHRVKTDLLSLVKVEIKVDLENCNILSLSLSLHNWIDYQIFEDHLRDYSEQGSAYCLFIWNSEVGNGRCRTSDRAVREKSTGKMQMRELNYANASRVSVASGILNNDPDISRVDEGGKRVKDLKARKRESTRKSTIHNGGVYIRAGRIYGLDTLAD